MLPLDKHGCSSGSGQSGRERGADLEGADYYGIVVLFRCRTQSSFPFNLFPVI